MTKKGDSAREDKSTIHGVEAAKAYDGIATTYDQDVLGDAWMRDILWQHFARIFQSGDNVLDVGCGTGIDALFLARHGINVTAIDASSEMVAQVRTRVSRINTKGRIDAYVMDLRHLSYISPGKFDGIISSFAALNTLPMLDNFAQDAARLLCPNGRLVVHMLNRFSLWEWVWLLRQHKWSDARRLGRERERTFVIGGQPVLHYMVSADEARAAFSRHFSIVDAYGLGIFRPPHNLRRLPPGLVTALGGLDQRIGAYGPVMNCGRFIVLGMVKKP